MEVNLSTLREIVEDRGAPHAVVGGVTKSDLATERQQLDRMPLRREKKCRFKGFMSTQGLTSS